MAKTNDTSKKTGKTIAIVVIVAVLLIAVVLALTLPKHLNANKAKGSDITVSTMSPKDEADLLGEIDGTTDPKETTLMSEEELKSITDASDNPYVKINAEQACHLAGSRYQGYDFVVNNFGRTNDGTWYYVLEGVDDRGNTKNIKMNAMNGDLM